MPGSPLEDFAKRHKSHFPASVGTGRPRPCSTTGETEAGRGTSEKPTSLVAVSPKCLYPAWRRQPAITPRHRAGSRLRPAGLPRGAALLPGFGKREARGKKKKKRTSLLATKPARGGGSWTMETCVLSQFLPVASCNHGSEGLSSPRMLSHQQPPWHRPAAPGAAQPGLPEMVLGRGPSCPRSPSPFGTRGHPPPSPGSPDRAFCRWMAGSGCTGCHSTSPPAQRGQGQD